MGALKGEKEKTEIKNQRGPQKIRPVDRQKVRDKRRNNENGRSGEEEWENGHNR
jgi:hypothetical protein